MASRTFNHMRFAHHFAVSAPMNFQRRSDLYWSAHIPALITANAQQANPMVANLVSGIFRLLQPNYSFNATPLRYLSAPGVTGGAR